MSWLREFVIRWMVRKAAADGERMARGKTYFAGIGQLLTGLSIIANALYTGHWHDMFGGWLLILTGLTTLGLGHKVEKQTAAVTKLLDEVLRESGE